MRKNDLVMPFPTVPDQYVNFELESGIVQLSVTTPPADTGAGMTIKHSTGCGSYEEAPAAKHRDSTIRDTTAG